MAKKPATITTVIYNKEDLIGAIAESQGVSRVEAQKAINLMFGGVEAIAEKMNSGDKLQLVGKMTIECTTKDAYTGHNPRTKEPIAVPAKNSLKVKFGNDIAKLVKQPEEAKKEAPKAPKADKAKKDAKGKK